MLYHHAIYQEIINDIHTWKHIKKLQTLFSFHNSFEPIIYTRRVIWDSETPTVKVEAEENGETAELPKKSKSLGAVE